MTFTKQKFAILLATLCAFITVMSFGLYKSGLANVFFGYSQKSLPIYSVETNEKKVAITFDCAWGVDYTDKLLEIFRFNEVKVTFFTVEFWAKKYPEYLAKIDADGHEIGTHSATHGKMSTFSKDKITSELTTSSTAITEVTKKPVDLFRAPFGDYNNQLIDTAKELGFYTIQWDVDSLDWKDLSAKEIRDRVLKKVKNGSIVLFHNNATNTAEALETIIPTLKNSGYEFCTVGELIYKTDYDIKPDGTQILRQKG